MSLEDIRESLDDMETKELLVIGKEVNRILREKAQGPVLSSFRVTWNGIRDLLMEYDSEIDIQNGRNIKSSNYRRVVVYLAYMEWFRALNFNLIAKAIGFDRGSIGIMCKDTRYWLSCPMKHGDVLRSCVERVRVLYEILNQQEI